MYEQVQGYKNSGCVSENMFSMHVVIKIEKGTEPTD